MNAVRTIFLIFININSILSFESALASPGTMLLSLRNNATRVKNTAALQEVPANAPSGEKDRLDSMKQDIDQRLKELKITLPEMAKPVGNYLPFALSGKQVFINQIAVKNGIIEHPGRIGNQVSLDEARAAVRQTMLNILAALKEAGDGDLSRVKRCVQLTGYFYSVDGFVEHPLLMNEASDLLVSIFDEQGKHARATVGVSSLPLNSPVEIQAIFELK